jgi:outer membrane protein assembly factor BamB
MKTLRLLLATTLILQAADWLNPGGDARQSGWQKRERELSPKTISRLRLIWKMKLDAPLSPAVILGHLKTHRGTVELVFTLSSAREIYAIDGDFGKVFWHLRLQGTDTPCGKQRIALTPSSIDEDEDDDAPQPVRPLYVSSGDGLLHGLDPSNGRELSTTRYSCRDTRRSELIVSQAGGIDFKLTRSSAAWQDDTGKTWTYSAGPSGRMMAKQGGTIRWSSPKLKSPGTPVIAGGIVFILDCGSQKVPAVLYAFDAITGKQIYDSGHIISSFATNGDLAIANGHICFSTADGTLYCFGFPVDI